jgi:protein-tyrosine-phosphatase
MSGVALLMVVAAAAVAGDDDRAGRPRRGDVVFVCAHGNVKSLIASAWFNRLADERGVAARAIARGLTPENPVPAPIAERLRREGLDVDGFEARPLAPADLDGASHLVLIGVEAPAWAQRGGLAVEAWDGIPPASERYLESRDAMRARIEALIARLPRDEQAR